MALLDEKVEKVEFLLILVDFVDFVRFHLFLRLNHYLQAMSHLLISVTSANEQALKPFKPLEIHFKS